MWRRELRGQGNPQRRFARMVEEAVRNFPPDPVVPFRSARTPPSSAPWPSRDSPPSSGPWAPGPGRDALSSVWPGWALAAAVAVLLAGLGLPLTDGDTALYALVARDALARGEWIAYTFRDGQIFDKPPLTLWLLQASIGLLGPTEWAIRLWHLALALATAAVTYRLARLALPAAHAVGAAVVLLTSVQFFYQALVPQQDVPLTLFVALAMYGYLRWEEEGGLAAPVLAGTSAGLAVLSKGLVGLVLPVLIVASRVVIDRPRLPDRWLRALGAAAGAFLLVAVPWFVAAGLRYGQQVVETFMLDGSLGVGRFFRPVLSEPEQLPAPARVLAYVIFLPLGFLPWTGWLWPAMCAGYAARADRTLRTCFLWVVCVVAFLSASQGDKVIRYLLPVFPAAAVLVAYGLTDSRGDRPAIGGSAVCAALLGAAFVGFLSVPLPEDLTVFRVLAGALVPPLVGGLAGGALLLRSGRRPQAVTVLTFLVLLGYGLLLGATAYQRERVSPWASVGRLVNATAPDVQVFVQGEPTPFAEWYIHRRVTFVSQDRLVRLWRTRQVVAVVPAKVLDALPAPPRAVVIGSVPGRLVVVRNF